MLRKPYILYIEDERPAIELVRQILELAGYKEVMGTTSGEHGLAMMRADKPALLLLDLMMPHPNGFDVYREMKRDARLADIPVIVVTVKVPKNGRIIVSDLPPVTDYITKPFKPERLVRAVRNVIGEKVNG